MKKLLLVFVVLFCSVARLQAQYYTNENKQWVFGSHAGLNFSSGVPIPFASSSWSIEACAAVADATGNMLFYSQGSDVFNQLGSIMPSGAGVVPFFTISVSQGAVIVPMPGSPGKYYLFSLGGYAGSDPDFYLRYSIVDMALDGGLGDVVPGAVGIPLFDSLSEKMVAVKGEGCSVWLITHRSDSNRFLSFRITPAGIEPPVSSICGSFSGNAAYKVGVLKASHNRRQLVAQSMMGYGGSGTELYNFDTTTGIVSGCRVLSTAWGAYGAEFSPDDTKLYTKNYVSAPDRTEVWQYDISLPTVAAMIASRVVVHTYPGLHPADLKLAPDNKIYTPHRFTTFLDCIAAPNAAGLACDYIADAIDVGDTVIQGLPATVIVSEYVNTTSSGLLHFCYPADTAALGVPLGSDFSYYWHDGTTAPTHAVAGSGLYWVHASNGCTTRIDTFNVVVDTLYPVNLGNDTTITSGTMLVLSATHPGASVLWNTGSVTDTIHAVSGSYWVRVTRDGCSVTDSINIFPPAGFAPITGAAHIVIYPNPANDIITVKATALSGNAVTVLCYNMVGSNVLTHNYQVVNGTLNAPIAVGTLPAGVYYLCIEDGAGRSGMQKVIIGHHN